MDQCALRVLILGCFAVDSGGNFRVSSSVIMRNLFIFHLPSSPFFLMLSILRSCSCTKFPKDDDILTKGAHTAAARTQQGNAPWRSRLVDSIDFDLTPTIPPLVYSLFIFHFIAPPPVIVVVLTTTWTFSRA